MPSEYQPSKSVPKSLPKAPAASKVASTSKNTCNHQPNVFEHQKYPEFKPTFEFQELHSWQRVPVGCITQMNLQTGKKYCKYDPNYLRDPNYGIPACLRKKEQELTPPKKESQRV